MKSLCKSR